MSTFQNNYDSLELIIKDENLKIKAIDFDDVAKTILVALNTSQQLILPLSLYAHLYSANVSQLTNYEIIANGTGVHWPELDEDLSLKGFLKEALILMVHRNPKVA